MQVYVLTLITLLAPLLAEPVLGDDAKSTCTLITQHILQEGQGPFGRFKSQVLVEIRLTEHQARQDSYLRGVKGKPHLHTTVLYFPEDGEVVNIFHRTKQVQRLNGAGLEEQKRVLRDTLPKNGSLLGERPKLIATEETSNVGGYEVRKYTATPGPGNITFWIVEDSELTELWRLQFELMSTPAGELAALQMPDPRLFPGYPIKFTFEINRQGMKVLTTIVSSIDFQAPLEDGYFSVPTGYTPLKSTHPNTTTEVPPK